MQHSDTRYHLYYENAYKPLCGAGRTEYRIRVNLSKLGEQIAYLRRLNKRNILVHYCTECLKELDS